MKLLSEKAMLNYRREPALAVAAGPAEITAPDILGLRVPLAVVSALVRVLHWPGSPRLVEGRPGVSEHRDSLGAGTNRHLSFREASLG